MNGFADLLRLAQVGCWEWEVQQDRVTWSDELYRIFGLDRADHNGTFEGYLRLVHPDERESVRQRVNRAVQARGQFEFEQRINRPNGDLRVLHTWGKVSKDRTSNQVRVVGICQDITEQSRVDTALRDSEQRYRLLFEEANDILFTTDLKGRVTSANLAAERTLGYRLADGIGTHVSKIVAPEYKFLVEEMLRKKISGTLDARYEIDLIAKDGRRIAVEVSSHLISRNGSPIGIQGIARDISESKLVKTQLEYQASLLSHIQDAIIATDASFAITSWNAAAEQMCGWKAKEVLGRQAQEVFPIELSPLDRLKISHKLLNDGPIRGEYALPRKDGLSIILEFTAMALRDSNGTVTGFVSVCRDVTQRKAAESALAERERQLSEAQQLAHVGSWEWQVQADRVTWTDELFRIFGLDPGRFGATFQSYLDLVHPDDKSRVRQVIESSLRSLEPFTYECRVVKQDRIVRMLHARGQVISDEAGHPIRMIGIAQDITERKQTEMALEESESRMRALVESMDDIAIEVDEHGKYLNIWTTNEGLLPRPKTEMIGHHVGDFLGKARMRPFYDAFERVLRTGRPESFEFESPFPTKPRWLSVRVSLIQTGNGAGNKLGVLVRDITDKKRTELELRRGELKFRGLVDAAPDALLGVDSAGVIVLANIQSEKLFGYSRDEVLGKAVEVLIPELQRLTHVSQRALYNSDPRVRPMGAGLELFAQRKDGTQLPVEISLSPLRTEQGLLVICAIRDVTERKLAHEKLRELSSQLLRSQDEERRRIARELHDSTAQGLAGLVMNLGVVNRCNSALDRAAQEALAESLSLAKACANEIRTISYLLHPPMLDEFGLPDALKWYVEGFNRRSGIETSLAIADKLPRMSQESEITLFRIVQEGLTNIYQHSGAKRAQIEIGSDATHVTLKIRDLGHGMRAEQMVAGADLASLGVGILGMRERVKQLNGVLALESSGEGTVLQVTLPLIRGPQ